MSSTGTRTGRLAALAALALVLTAIAFLVFGSDSAARDPARSLRALRASVGWTASDDPTGLALLHLRLWRFLTAAGVGGALALSGALLQGLFRNALASPSVLGITTGASVGAAFAVGVGARVGIFAGALGVASTTGAWLVPACAFAGAAFVGWIVQAIAATRGHLSVPTLLLVGLAMNTLLGGVLHLMQQMLLDEYGAARSLIAWSLGTLDDRSVWHAGVVWMLGLPCCLLAPRIAWELDLLQSGEEDARQLGVDTRRVRWIAFVLATVATAGAVAVAGQIAFVGLIVPHIVRLLGAQGHKALLILSALAGAAFLPAADLFQILAFENQLAPGVVLSLIGGPFFVWLLWQKRRELALW